LNAWQVNGTYSGLSINSSKWEINRHYYFENGNAIPALVKLYRAQNTSALAGFINYTRAHEHRGFDPVSNVYPIKLGLTVEIVFQLIGAKGDAYPDTHPWHMHGSNFYDMGAGPGEFTEKAFQTQLSGRCPIQRDTTLGYTKAGEFVHAPFDYQGVYPCS
jgi:L-ascorbate oxidase